MISEMNIENCSFLRRLGAMIYDSMLLFSLLLFATIPYLFFVGGEAIDSGDIFFQIYLIIIILLYFILPWKIRGQTLGMQSWKIKLVQEPGDSIVYVTYGQGIKRLFFSCLSWIPAGLGFIWSLFDQDKLAWHDRLSKTKLIYISKPKN